MVGQHGASHKRGPHYSDCDETKIQRKAREKREEKLWLAITKRDVKATVEEVIKSTEEEIIDSRSWLGNCKYSTGIFHTILKNQLVILRTLGELVKRSKP